MKTFKGLIKYILFMTMFFTVGYFISEFKTTASPVVDHHASFYGFKAFNLDAPQEHYVENNSKFWGVPEL